MTTAGNCDPTLFAGLNRYPVKVVLRSALAKVTRSAAASCALAGAETQAAAITTAAVTLRRCMAQHRLGWRSRSIVGHASGAVQVAAQQTASEGSGCRCRSFKATVRGSRVVTRSGRDNP